MNKKCLSTFLVSIMLIMLETPCTADSVSSSSARNLSNSLITTRIKTELTIEHVSSLFHIKVATYDLGAVTLSGNIHSQLQADEVAAIALKVKDVVSVESNIRVLPER